ncbi:kinase-like domain-containing protein [Cantharellus anzutake]|uniref:kinase-like domain-containing protein n=1 Tax=Cantharellus anzutake TaxID=1750568 RepID=UPI001907FD56|nr:kinase-like domain-containing protein [Cantharellus anzutake]KAF8323485.1 kinase-like domain-containing protein [Cantharellus anzutake]
MTTLSDEVESFRQAVVQALLQVDGRNLDGVIGLIGPAKRRETFGKIYKGVYNKSVVCIKSFKNIESEDSESHPEFLRRLVREVKVWSQLAHKHIVKLHGWTSYIDSKQNLCPNGGDVKAFLRRYPDADRRALVCGIAQGLNYLHLKDVVHANMKPESVVVSDGSIPQLCDFDLSFIIWDTSTHINTTELFEALRYIAPEVCEKNEPFRDKGTDVWGFGCIAMEILRGQRPYATIRNEFAVYWAIGRSEPPFALPVMQPTEEILVLCLNPDPEQRIGMQTVTEHLERSDNCLATQSLSPAHQFSDAAILNST